MFISQLNDKLNAYDRYGEHRINGFKVLFVLDLMMLFNMFSSMQNPYFYFFYAPITCITAELIGNSLREKYLFLGLTLVGSALSIFLFGTLSVYTLFFVFFVFIYSMALYLLALSQLKHMIVIVPVILSLASYSLVYGLDANSNLYIAFSHALQTLVAGAIILGGLFLFPKIYYFYIWKRAFLEVIVHLEILCDKICKEEVKEITIFSGIIVMERYSKMLPSHLKTYSILKITLLTFELILTMSYLISFQQQLRIQYVKVLHHYLKGLSEACTSKQVMVIHTTERALFNQTRELQLLYKLIQSWNYLCVSL